MLTHFPIVATVCGFILLTGGYLINNTVVKRSAMVLFIFAALIAVPAFITGEAAEEVVEIIPGIKKQSIEEHEELASGYIWIIGSLGVISLLTLFFDLLNIGFFRMLYLITLFISMIAMAVSYRVGNLGGEIRHSELNSINQEIYIKSNHDD